MKMETLNFAIALNDEGIKICNDVKKINALISEIEGSDLDKTYVYSEFFVYGQEGVKYGLNTEQTIQCLKSLLTTRNDRVAEIFSEIEKL